MKAYEDLAGQCLEVKGFLDHMLCGVCSFGTPVKYIFEKKYYCLTFSKRRHNETHQHQNKQRH